MLYEVNRLAAFANEYERNFVKAMLGRSAKVAENDRARKQRELNALLTRDKELDMLFERLYEDNVAGKIDDARFARMSKRYEQEQGEICLLYTSFVPCLCFCCAFGFSFSYRIVIVFAPVSGNNMEEMSLLKSINICFC